MRRHRGRPELEGRPVAALTEHPLRTQLAGELHTRPHPDVEAPAGVSHVARLMGEASADDERAHVAELCARYSAPPPPEGVLHYGVQLGDLRLHWERHTEFSTHTVIAGGSKAPPFARATIELLPEDWRDATLGEVIAACHVVVLAADRPAPDSDELKLWFEGQRLLGCDVMSGAARVWTALRVHGDGFGRFVVHDRSLAGGQTGRLVQRLFELDTYIHMAMLGLPEARRLAPQLSALEQSLARLTAATASAQRVASDRALLDELFQLAAEVEHLQADRAYRFGAVRAYDGIVNARLGELGERPIRGLQPLGEFLDRRFEPAVLTTLSVETRLDSLGRRVGSTVDLLRTRVDLQIEQQNQSVLRSMDQRARLQLRLQQMVEGLSVVAISYYAVSLVAYFLQWLELVTFGDDAKNVVLSILTPLVVLGVWLGLRRAKRALELDAAD